MKIMFSKLLNSKFKKDLLFSYVVQAITVSFGFLQLFLINRYFGISTFGQLAIIISTAGIFSSILTARSSEAVTRFFKREELSKNYENAKFVLFIGFSIDFITATLLLILIYFLSHFIATTFLKDVSLQDEIVIYSFITFFRFLRGSMFGYLQSKEMFIKINLINIVEISLKIVILIVFIFILKNTILISIIYTFLIASIISFLYTIYIFLNCYFIEFKNIKLKFNKGLLKEYWNFNIKTFISSSLKAGNQNIDNLILGYFINSEIVGIYQVMKKILSPIMIISQPFSMLVYTKLIHYFETNQKDKFKQIIIKISFYILIIGIIYGIISFIILPYIFEIMNINYIRKYNLYYLFMIMLIILNSQMWWVRAFSNTVNPNYSIYMNMFATFFQLTITIIMSKYFGFIGMLSSIIVMNSLILSFWLKKGYKYVYIYIYTYIINIKDLLIK